MAGWRPPYTLEEDRTIIRYIVDGDLAAYVGGNRLWKQMEEEKIVSGRTWQSLKNRWKKTLVLDLGRPEYNLTQVERAIIKEEMASTVRKQIRIPQREEYSPEPPEEDHQEERPEERPKEHLTQRTKEHPKDGQSEHSTQRPKEPLKKRQPEDSSQRRTTKEVTKKPEELTHTEKCFYSLDMDWSDDSSD